MMELNVCSIVHYQRTWQNASPDEIRIGIAMTIFLLPFVHSQRICN